MALIHKKPKTRGAFNPLLADPTRTTTLRRVFSQALRGRLKILAQRVNQVIISENALGIRSDNPAFNTRWMFNTTSEQVKAFATWFLEQAQELLYGQEENSWWREYVQKAYEQGAGSTWEKWKSKSNFLQGAFNNPVQIERVKTLAGRVLTELKNVTQTMATQMSRSLVDGLAQGKSPRDVAKDLTATVSGLGENRAAAIAQTETIRAHAEGQLDSLENLGMDQVGVQVEWSTSGLGKTKVTGSKKSGFHGGYPSPCKQCAPMKGAVFTIQEARGLIPRHCNCRCSWTPAGVGEDTSGQKIGKRPINDALRQSIKAEIPAASKTTLAQQMSRTKWVGADRIGKISGKPPGEISENFNPNHDSKGRFSSAPSLVAWRQSGGKGKTAEGKKYNLKYTVGQHESVYRIKLDESQAQKLVDVTSDHFGISRVPVKVLETSNITGGKANASVDFQRSRINLYADSSYQVHSLAHELAHVALGFGADMQHVFGSIEGHGEHHRRLRDEIYDFMVDHGLERAGIPRYTGPMKYGDRDKKATRNQEESVENFNPNHDKEGKFSSVPSSVMSDFNKMMDVAMVQAKPPEKPATMKIYEAMSHVEPGADNGALVTMKDLRKHTQLPKEKFDKAVIDLFKSQMVMPHYHDFASSLAPHELAELVDSGTDQHANAGRYWVGIAKRRGTTNSESVMLSLARKDN